MWAIKYTQKIGTLYQMLRSMICLYVLGEQVIQVNFRYVTCTVILMLRGATSLS